MRYGLATCTWPGITPAFCCQTSALTLVRPIFTMKLSTWDTIWLTGGIMKEIVLFELKKNDGKYVSGEELSRRLGVSRTAVWKHISGLRDEGYEIESSPRHGYRLVSVPELLLPSEIRDGLETDILGQKIVHLHDTDSTNSIARELGSRGWPEGTVVVAERQRAGRGRLGRQWISPEGGIWLSLLLRPKLLPQQVQLLTLAAGVAAVRATRGAAGIEPGIKWPNDLLLGQRKLAGILSEISAEMDLVHYLVLGIGVNANIPEKAFPIELAATMTSLLAETGRPVYRAGWVRLFLKEMEFLYLQALSQNFSAILAGWRDYSVTLGREVTIRLPGRQVRGFAENIDDSGALLVRTSLGLETFPAGEVTLREE